MQVDNKIDFDNTDNRILIDWFSFTSKIDSPQSIIDLMGLVGVKFTECNGAQGYRNRLAFDGINIHYNHRINEGIWVEMSGKGCRAFESYSLTDFNHLIHYILDSRLDSRKDYNITRVDIAYDSFNGVIPINQFAKDVLNQNFVSKFSDKSMLVTCSAGRVGYTIDCGSRHSDVRFRCYDKAYERGYLPEDNVSWIRFEIQLRDDRALNFLSLVDSDNLGILFSGVVSNYLRVVRPSLDSNKSRWPVKKWWIDFLHSSERISIFTKCDVDYNLEKCEDYVYHQCGNALDTLLSLKGVDSVLHELKSRKPDRSEKYLKIINDNGGNIIDYLREREAL